MSAEQQQAAAWLALWDWCIANGFDRHSFANKDRYEKLLGPQMVAQWIVDLQRQLSLNDAIAIAKGCYDYGGGHRSDGTLEVFHHGIQTVVNALEAAKDRGLSDSQVAVLHHIGTVAER